MSLPGEQWSILARLGSLYQSSGEAAKAREVLTQAAEIVQALATKIGDENLRIGFLRSIQSSFINLDVRPQHI